MTGPWSSRSAWSGSWGQRWRSRSPWGPRCRCCKSSCTRPKPSPSQPRKCRWWRRISSDLWATPERPVWPPGRFCTPLASSATPSAALGTPSPPWCPPWSRWPRGYRAAPPFWEQKTVTVADCALTFSPWTLSCFARQLFHVHTVWVSHAIELKTLLPKINAKNPDIATLRMHDSSSALAVNFKKKAGIENKVNTPTLQDGQVQHVEVNKAVGQQEVLQGRRGGRRRGKGQI